MNKKALLILGTLLVFPVSCLAIALKPPLPTITDLVGPSGLVNKIVDVIYTVALWITPVFIMVGAVSFLTSAGDPEKTKNARGIVTWSIVGLLIATAANGFISLITGTIGGTQVPLSTLLVDVANIIYYFVITLAVVFIILGSIEFLTSGGEPEKVTQARNRIIYAIVAVVVAIAANGIVSLITSTVQ